MEVKILTMHRVINYGSFMQAYALKRAVERFGHHVTFCDFQKGEARHHGHKIQRRTWTRKLERLAGSIRSPRRAMERRQFGRTVSRYIRQVAWPLLGITEELNMDYSGDLMIIGSDEVFNYTQDHALGYVPALFGHGISARSIVAYAASAGYTNLVDISLDGMEQELASGLARFQAIGVRDQNTFDIVQRYAGLRPELVIDPTMLYDFSSEVAPQRLVQEEYVLVYAYGGRMDSPEEIAAIRRFARARRLKIVSTAFYHEWCDQNIAVKPFELLALFAHAAYIVTDTFHGCIFCIKSRKQFVTFLRPDNRLASNVNKVGFLLQQLGLDSRVVTDIFELDRQLATSISYRAVEERLHVLRTASMDFLGRALGNASQLG